ncbi:uncharacterized protein LOC141853662 [Brevipalpus obovatus]|uniref:uncharacterized protein LOC141853662 n=1 Tax=Brevipalpus obovatus TaxID=246614 RepID=UPI003D9E6D0D
MGSFLSCCWRFPSNESHDTSVNERTRILNDPVDGRFISDDALAGDTYNSKEPTNYGTISVSKNEVNNAWNRTLDKMMTSVIDVTSANMPPVEPTEYSQRAVMYTNRINQLRQPLCLKFRAQNRSNNILKKVDINTKMNLSEISPDDISLINETACQTFEAVKEGFTVSVTEDIVVVFNP